MTSNAWTSVLIRGALFVAAYFGLTYIGVPLRIEAIDASPVWLPHGLSVAALLIFGPRFWPAVTLAVIAGALSRGFPLWITLELGFVKAAEVLLAASGLTPWSRLPDLVVTWWLGDAMGVLILVPVVLAFVTPRRWSFDRNAVTALVLIGSALFVACELAFGRLLAPSSDMPFAYLPFPLIFWASLRFGVHGAALSSCFASLHATV